MLLVEYMVLTLPRTIGIEVISSPRAPCVLPTFGTFFYDPLEDVLDG